MGLAHSNGDYQAVMEITAYNVSLASLDGTCVVTLLQGDSVLDNQIVSGYYSFSELEPETSYRILVRKVAVDPADATSLNVVTVSDETFTTPEAEYSQSGASFF